MNNSNQHFENCQNRWNYNYHILNELIFGLVLIMNTKLILNYLNNVSKFLDSPGLIFFVMFKKLNLISSDTFLHLITVYRLYCVKSS